MEIETVRTLLGDAVIKNLQKPVEQARGLPGIAFTDDRFFKLEQTTLFPRTWTSIGFAHHLPDIGDAIPIDVMGLPLVIVRGKDMKVRVFHNVCRHRGTKVVLEPTKGATLLKCMYHCWVYDLEGILRGTPMWDGTKNPRPNELDRSTNSLVEVRSAVLWDVIYINLDSNAPDITNYFSWLIKRYAGWDFASLVPYKTNTRYINGNWKLNLEGYIEGYHEPYVHPQLPSRVTDDHSDALFTPHVQGNVFGTSIPAEGGYEMNKIGAGKRFPPISAPSGTEPGLDIFVMFPNTSIVVAPDHILNWVWTPTGPEKTCVSVTMYLAKEAMTTDFAEERENLFRWWDEVMEQDIAAVEAQQPARHSPVGDDIKFSAFWEGRVHYLENKVVDTML